MLTCGAEDGLTLGGGCTVQHTDVVSGDVHLKPV